MGIMDFLFGKSETKTTMPDWLKELGSFGSDRAQAVANLGFAPWQGPDVAAFSPMQTAAMQGINQAASAYGMPSSRGTGMPEPETFAGGVRGYSSFPLYQQQMDALRQSNPDLYNAYAGIFASDGMDPIRQRPQGGANPAGQGGGGTEAPTQTLTSMSPEQFATWLNGRRNSETGGGRSAPGMTRPRARPDGLGQPQPQFNGLLDRIDGGGPGAGLMTGLRNGRDGLLNAIFGGRV